MFCANKLSLRDSDIHLCWILLLRCFLALDLRNAGRRPLRLSFAFRRPVVVTSRDWFATGSRHWINFAKTRRVRHLHLIKKPRSQRLKNGEWRRPSFATRSRHFQYRFCNVYKSSNAQWDNDRFLTVFHHRWDIPAVYAADFLPLYREQGRGKITPPPLRFLPKIA